MDMVIKSGFHRKVGYSWEIEKLIASAEKPCSMEPVYIY